MERVQALTPTLQKPHEKVLSGDIKMSASCSTEREDPLERKYGGAGETKEASKEKRMEIERGDEEFPILCLKLDKQKDFCFIYKRWRGDFSKTERTRPPSVSSLIYISQKN